MCAPSCFRFRYVARTVPSPKASLTAQFPVRSEAKLGLPDAAKSTAKNPERVFMAAAAYNKSISDRKSTRLNSSHVAISYAVFCLKKKKKMKKTHNKPQKEDRKCSQEGK